jgi:hypothetical protein
MGSQENIWHTADENQPISENSYRVFMVISRGMVFVKSAQVCVFVARNGAPRVTDISHFALLQDYIPGSFLSNLLYQRPLLKY